MPHLLIILHKFNIPHSQKCSLCFCLILFGCKLHTDKNVENTPLNNFLPWIQISNIQKYKNMKSQEYFCGCLIELHYFSSTSKVRQKKKRKICRNFTLSMQKFFCVRDIVCHPFKFYAKLYSDTRILHKNILPTVHIFRNVSTKRKEPSVRFFYLLGS